VDGLLKSTVDDREERISAPMLGHIAEAKSESTMAAESIDSSDALTSSERRLGLSS
jgi:hypothetical protein